LPDDVASLPRFVLTLRCLLNFEIRPSGEQHSIFLEVFGCPRFRPVDEDFLHEQFKILGGLVLVALVALA